MDSCIPDTVLGPVSPFWSGLAISLDWPIPRVVKAYVVITRSTHNKINQGNNSKTYLEKVCKWPHHEVAFRDTKQNDCSVERKKILICMWVNFLKFYFNFLNQLHPLCCARSNKWLIVIRCLLLLLTRLEYWDTWKRMYKTHFWLRTSADNVSAL